MCYIYDKSCRNIPKSDWPAFRDGCHRIFDWSLSIQICRCIFMSIFYNQCHKSLLGVGYQKNRFSVQLHLQNEFTPSLSLLQVPKPHLLAIGQCTPLMLLMRPKRPWTSIKRCNLLKTLLYTVLFLWIVIQAEQFGIQAPGGAVPLIYRVISNKRNKQKQVFVRNLPTLGRPRWGQ